MAHLNIRREFRAWRLRLRDQLPLDCLLCRSRTPGGLCEHCSAAVQASMGVETPRCGRCALNLAPVLDGDAAVRGQGGWNADRLYAAPSENMVMDVVSAAARRMGLQHRLPSAANIACPDCALLSSALVRVVTAFDYAWPGELLIQRLKRGGRFSCAPALAVLLARRCHALRSVATPLWSDTALITAVPASRASLLLRGYNPAAEVGHALAQRLDLEWQPGLLLRTREGGTQKNLNRHARRRDVQGLYHCPGGVAGREVLVVDDVMTTGSTLSAIARTLSAQGATQVWGAVLARTPSRMSGDDSSPDHHA